MHGEENMMADHKAKPIFFGDIRKKWIAPQEN